MTLANHDPRDCYTVVAFLHDNDMKRHQGH
jgi:hypothetical protein